MESEIQREPKKFEELHQVTPLSKYLAMILFVLLPFVGGWIGYNYAPEKVVEVERVEVQKPEVTGSQKKVEKEADKTSPSSTASESSSVRTIVVEEGLPLHGSFTYDLDYDKADWTTYVNEEYGFSFMLSPKDEVRKWDQADFDRNRNGTRTEDVFVIIEDSSKTHWIPTVSVKENSEQIGILEQFEETLYEFTSDVFATTVDGRPAFWMCTLEMGGCSGYVVTEKYVFRLNSISNITFDERIVGSSETNIIWPETVSVHRSG